MSKWWRTLLPRSSFQHGDTPVHSKCPARRFFAVLGSLRCLWLIPRHAPKGRAGRKVSERGIE